MLEWNPETYSGLCIMSHVTMFSQYSAVLAPEHVFDHGDSQEKRAHASMWHSCMGAHAGLPDAMHYLAIHRYTT